MGCKHDDRYARPLQQLCGGLFFRTDKLWIPRMDDNEDNIMKLKRAIALLIILIGIMGMVLSCSPKIIEHTVTEIEYRDRVIHDTATVEITKEVEKVVTRDTLSRLEIKYAKSEAMVSSGLLHHSLESKPQYIKVPVEVHVTDTLWKQSEIKEIQVPVEKQLSWWQKFRLGAFWWLLGAVVALLLWTFMKLLFKLFL